MKRRKQLAALAISAVFAAGAMMGCGGSSGNSSSQENSSGSAAVSGSTSDEKTSAAGETYKIGVLQYMPHAALDSANEGFFAALDDLGVAYDADQQNAAGEQANCQTIGEQLVNDGSDLIFVIGTQAAQTVAGITQDIPIVLTAVTDPADAGVVASNEEPGGNVTGTSDLTPVADQIELLTEILPDAKTVGMLYNSGEPNSQFQIEIAKEACDKAGLKYKDLTVSSSNEIQTVVESAVGQVDVLYTPTDNLIANGMATVAMIALENNLPVVCGEEGCVKAGGLVTYGIDYYELGYKAGEQAARILTEDADPAEMPIEYLDADQCSLVVNEDTMKALGLDLTSLEGAEFVKTETGAE